MVAIRRVKRLIQFSILAAVVATLLLILQWREISDSEKFDLKRRGELFDGAKENDNFGSFFATVEREFKKQFNHLVGSENAADDKDDWKRAFNKKAKHQAELNNNNYYKTRKTANGTKMNHVENRQLMQVFNESQTPNTTSSARTRTNASIDISSTLSNASKGLDKSKPLQKNSGPKHANHFIHATPTWKTFTWTKKMLGSLNVHIWQAWCGSTIHDLRRNKFFPLYPDVQLTVKKFFIRHWEKDYGQRIFGYIHPPQSGNYSFAISSDDSSELWLSSDENPSNVKLIAWVGDRTLLHGIFQTKIAQFTKYKSQMSRPVFLQKGQKYFIEVLHKQGSLQDHVLVGWKIPGKSHFRHLSGKSISLFIDDERASKDVTFYAQFIPQDLPSHSHYRTSRLDPNVFQFGSDDLRDKAHTAEFVDERDIEKLFPSCPYKPSYQVDFKLKRYEGVYLIHDTAIYPDDHTDLTHMKQYDNCASSRLTDSHGNRLPSLDVKERDQNLYENGSIMVFRTENGLVPLSFAKSAAEIQQAEEELSEMQMDIRDIKRRSQEVGDAPARPVKTVVHSNTASDSVLEKDVENVFEMKKKAKRKTMEKRSASLRNQNSSYNFNRDNKITKEKFQGSQVRLKEDNERGGSRHTRDRSRDKDSPDSVRNPSNGVIVTSQVGTRRKLLSYDTERDASSVNKQNDKSTVQSNYYLGDYHSYNSRAQRSRVSNTTYVKFRQRTGGVQYYPVDKEDDQFTRINAAREFIRRMAEAVQLYNQHINSRTLAEAVYRKFGLKMKIPNLYRVPDYNAWIFHQNSTKCASDGNLLLNNDVAVSVANKYVRALRKATDSKYSLKEIIDVEENHDVIQGDRYLIDVELNMEGKNSSVRLTQFVYQKLGTTEFCLPEGFTLDQHATVHIIIPVKNQGKWVQHFINNMVEISREEEGTSRLLFSDLSREDRSDSANRLYSETKDPHVNIILVDFSSTDIDVVAALERSGLKRYKVRKLKGAFQRAFGIQVGAALVKNPRDIIFMCDLHLQIPNNIVGIIRKHCVLGKMAFAPIVARLHCGFSPSLPYGFWELQGYGLFAMYKADFTRVGGMNFKEFRTTWGGEDWELLDRVLLSKMEVERLRVAKFYHYFHSKKGMWGTRNMFNARSVWQRFDEDTEIITLYNETREKEEAKRIPRLY